MKRLFRKDNRIARLVALWLVFIMALTPLYQHSGLKNPTRAATLPTEINYNVPLDLSNIEIVKDGTQYKINSMQIPAEADIPKIHAYYDDNGTIPVYKLSVSPKNGLKYSVTAADDSVTNYSMNAGYNVVGTVVTLDTLVGTSAYAPVEATSVAAEQYYAIYVSIADGCNDGNGTVIEAGDTSDDWTLQAIYKLVKDDSLTSNWRAADGTALTDGETYKEAYFGIAKQDGDLYIGDVEYYYAKYDSSVGDDAYITNSKYYNSLINTAPIESGTKLSKDSGIYVVWTKYDPEGDGTGDWYNVKANKISIDAVAPSLNLNYEPYVKDSDGNTINMDATSSLFSLQYGSTYALEFILSDAVDKEFAVKAISTDGTELALPNAITKKVGGSASNTYKIDNFTSGMSPNVTYTVIVTVQDELENTAYIELGKVMNSALVVTTDINKVDGENTTSIGKTFGDSYFSNLPHNLTLNISSGNKLQQFYLIEDGSNTLVYDDKFTNTLNNGVYTDITKGYTFSEQREYKNLQVKVFDGAWGTGEVIDLGSFTYDATAPDFSYVGLFKYDTAESKWTDISSDVDDDSNHWLDTTAITTTNIEGDTYRLVFKAKDELSGLNGGSYYITSDATKATTPLDSTTTTNVGDGYTEYSIELTTKAIMEKRVDGNVSFTAYAVDKAKNPSTEATTVNIKAADTSLRVEEPLLKDGPDIATSKVVNLSLNHNTSKAYYLYVTMKSGYPLDTIVLNYKGTDELGNVISKELDKVTITNDDNNASYNSETKEYTITKVIPIPKDITKNQLLTEVSVTVSDKCSPTAQVYTNSVGTLLFDQTRPVVSYTAPKSKWYQEYQMVATVTPGPQDATDPEANVADATYNIENASDNQLNGEGLNAGVTFATENKYATIKFYVPESANPAGTKITFNAFDEAGNPIADDNREVKIKVDATAPTINSLYINGADVKTTNYGPEINVSAKAQDNLALKKVTITLQKKQEDGTYADVETGKTFDIGNEGVTLETKFDYNKSPLADGDYKIVVVAEDYSGRTATKEANFSVSGALSATGTIYTLEDYEAGNTDKGKVSFDTKNADGTVTSTVSNEKYQLVVEVSSGYELDACLIMSGTEVIGTPSFENVKNENGFYSATAKYTFGGDASEEFDNLTLVVKDKNSTDSTKANVTQDLGSFTYDIVPPTMEFEGLYKSSDAGATWEKIDADDLDTQKNAYIIGSTSLTDLYRFVFGVNEDIAGVDKAILLCDGTEIKANNTGTKMSAGSTNAEYYAELTAKDILEDIGDNDKLRYMAQVTDLATNKSDVVDIGFDIEKPYEEFSLEATLYRVNPDGTKTSVDLDKDYCDNQPYVLSVTVSSLYEIKEIILSYGVDETAIKSITVTEDENTDGYDDIGKRYTVNVDIQIPQLLVDAEGKLFNQLLQDIKLTATDVSTGTDTKDVASLLYDATLPELVNNKRTDGALVDDQTWYKEYIFDAVITPGPQGENSTESHIASADYTITGSVNGDTQKQALTISDDGKAVVGFKVPDSKTLDGTKVVFNANDKAGNYLDANRETIIRVDSKAPTLGDIIVSDDNSYKNLVGDKVTLDITANDNLAVESIQVDVKQIAGGTATASRTFDSTSYTSMETTNEGVVAAAAYELVLADGTYEATIVAYDKAGNPSEVAVKTFEVDNTDPVVTTKISSGTMGGKQPSKNFDDTDRDYYYSSDVVVEFTYEEKNLNNITITDNGNSVSVDNWQKVGDSNKYVGTYTVKGDGLHDIKISASDKTGHVSATKSISFIKDTQAPTIAAILNGAISYSESDGVRIFTTDTTLAFSETDDNKDPNGFYYQMTKAVPDETPVVGQYDTTDFRSFTYSEEAEYTVNVYSVDMANNTSATRTVRFRIDKTAPNISIGGITSGGTSSSAVNLSLNMNELYWNDASGTVEIYMKSGEGFGEELIEEINYTPTGRNSAITRNLSESGIYRVEFNAQDSAGHTSTASSTFTIDTDVPVVTLEGVSNFDVTDQDVTISSTITEKFYASKKVTISGTMTDETGKVTPITIDDYSPTANPTVINKTFSADGIYDLTISCVDVAGNSDSKSVHFTIDKSEPVIGDLSDIDGKVLTSFNWDKDLDDLVSDLTVCDVHMYLNGQEYDGEEAVEDGSYVLLITAEDELGHKVEKSVEFVLDTKAPVFIVTGVEDNEKKLEPYNITVSLQLEEDSLTKVTLNDKVITITNNTATFNVSEVGEYKLYMEAVDEAGNVSSAEYKFELMSEEEYNFRIIIGIVAALLALTLLIIILKKRKKKDK